MAVVGSNGAIVARSNHNTAVEQSGVTTSMRAVPLHVACIVPGRRSNGGHPIRVLQLDISLRRLHCRHVFDVQNRLLQRRAFNVSTCEPSNTGWTRRRTPDRPFLRIYLRNEDLKKVPLMRKSKGTTGSVVMAMVRVQPESVPHAPARQHSYPRQEDG